MLLPLQAAVQEEPIPPVQEEPIPSDDNETIPDDNESIPSDGETIPDDNEFIPSEEEPSDDDDNEPAQHGPTQGLEVRATNVSTTYVSMPTQRVTVYDHSNKEQGLVARKVVSAGLWGGGCARLPSVGLLMTLG